MNKKAEEVIEFYGSAENLSNALYDIYQASILIKNL